MFSDRLPCRCLSSLFDLQRFLAGVSFFCLRIPRHCFSKNPIWEDVETEVGIRTPIRNAAVLLFDVKSNAYVFSPFANCLIILVTNSAPYSNVYVLRRVWVQDKRGIGLKMVNSGSKISRSVRRHFYPTRVPVIGSWHQTFVNYHQHNPAGMGISKCRRGIIGGASDNSGALAFSKNVGLALNRPKGANRYAYSTMPARHNRMLGKFSGANKRER